MTRKSKQAGGNLPLTHYERTKKFASSEYGTTQQRLAGHSQYQIGDCALSLTRLGSSALCTPSGYLHDESAILQYLLTRTQQIKEQQLAYERQERARLADSGEDDKERLAQFEESQTVSKKRKIRDPLQEAREDLKRTSYWLADAQPDSVTEQIEKPPERPQSPTTQAPLTRKELWPVHLKRENGKLICAVSDKAINTQSVIAYWIDKKKPGTIVLQSVYDHLVDENNECPITSRIIKYTRKLQKSGSSFAASGQSVAVQKYNPTIT
jgi:hypothetical protein